MNRNTFDKKFYLGRDKVADAFDRPEVYQRIQKEIEGQVSPSTQLPVAVARQYAEQLVYSVLKEMLVDESDSDSKA
ncbi:hypothetical protein DIS12_04700 [Leuconostoc citreum]|uniref:hypothetical protein n=1 Tax=Leuconostoc citreum TaxID=33964 RepID=UPI00112430F4|nr:hypothetical protein [Leuconostoc citreum]TOY70757.1 hypothetical protein DIS12_04700 [Leuconostoc citreum]